MNMCLNSIITLPYLSSDSCQHGEVIKALSNGWSSKGGLWYRGTGRSLNTHGEEALPTKGYLPHPIMGNTMRIDRDGTPL